MSTVDDVLSWGQLELGKPYVYGDEGPNTFDCSGLMQFIFGKVGVSLPRTAAQQQRFVTPVKTPQAGDLVFWGDPAYHVALYIGGGKIIAAPHAGAKVDVENVWGTPAGYGRVPGVATALTPAVATLTAAGSTVGGWVTTALGGGRQIVLEGAFVALGLGLVGWGLWHAVIKPQVGKLDQIGAVL